MRRWVDVRRFKDRGLGAIKVDEREGVEAGAAGGVGCFDVDNFCGIGPHRQHLIRKDERWRSRRVSAGLLLRHLFPVAPVNCLVGNRLTWHGTQGADVDLQL